MLAKKESMKLMCSPSQAAAAGVAVAGAGVAVAGAGVAVAGAGLAVAGGAAVAVAGATVAVARGAVAVGAATLLQAIASNMATPITAATRLGTTTRDLLSNASGRPVLLVRACF
jgi:type IV secretion system protein TrbL